MFLLLKYVMPTDFFLYWEYRIWSMSCLLNFVIFFLYKTKLGTTYFNPFFSFLLLARFYTFKVTKKKFIVEGQKSSYSFMGHFRTTLMSVSHLNLEPDRPHCWFFSKKRKELDDLNILVISSHKLSHIVESLIF